MPGGAPEESPVRPDVARQWHDVHYQQGLAGQPFSTTAPALDQAIYGSYGQQGYEAGVRARQREEQEAELQRQFDMAMGEFSSGLAESMSGFGDMQSSMLAEIEAQQAEYQAQLRAQELAMGQENVRSMEEARSAAITQARDFVNEYVSSATAQARLTGSDISFTDAEILQLTQNRFADLWSEGLEGQYREAAAAYGSSMGGGSLTRGIAGTFDDSGGLAGMYDVSGARGTATAGTPVSTVLTEEQEDEVLGRANIALG